MARSIVFGIVVLLMLGPAVSANRAQDSLLQEMYGQGVHAYFAGKYDQAHELFSTAIDQGSQDPRCHYFRGLAYAKLGRPDEAEADYKRGAELEAGGAAVQINVGQALQRVQGNLRLQLEEYRYSARLAARLKEIKEKKERYEQAIRIDPNFALAHCNLGAALGQQEGGRRATLAALAEQQVFLVAVQRAGLDPQQVQRQVDAVADGAGAEFVLQSHIHRLEAGLEQGLGRLHAMRGYDILVAREATIVGPPGEPVQADGASRSARQGSGGARPPAAWRSSVWLRARIILLARL